MSMTYSFLSEEFDGATARLFEFQNISIGGGGIFGGGGPGVPLPVRIASRTVSNGKATFSQAPFSPFAVTVADNTGMLFRSGSRTVGHSDIDEDGNLFRQHFVIHSPVTFAEDELSNLLPDLPLEIDDEKLSIEELDLHLHSSKIHAFGRGVKDGWIKFRFDYFFKLKPSTSIDPGQLLEVVTDSIDVRGEDDGFLGWLVNFLVDVLTDIFQNDIAKSMEQAVSEAINDAARAQISETGEVQDLTVTAYQVTQNTNELEIDAYGCALGTCPATAEPGSIRPRAKDQLDVLRQFRSRVLTSTPKGTAFARLYNRFGPEILRLAILHRDIFKLGDRVVVLAVRDFACESPRLSKDTAASVRALMKRLSACGSKELRMAIASLANEVDAFVEKDMRVELARMSSKLPEIAIFSADLDCKTRRGAQRKKK